jgi:hypothetical protein
MEITDNFFVGSSELKKGLSPGCSKLHIARKCTGKSPDKKAIESIKSWCSAKNDWTPIVVKNIPVGGFKIANFVSRWSTSNKLFEIVDPRGFKLQISCENLLALIKDEDISRGNIQSECVWGFDRIPYLMGIHGDTYKKYLSDKTKKEDRVKVTASNLVLGETYLKDNNTYYIYLGKANIDMVTDNSKNYNYGNHYSKDLPDLPLKTEVRGNFIFAEVYGPNLDKPLDRLSVNITKTCPKVYETDKSSTIQISDFASALDKKVFSNYSLYSLPTSKIPKELRSYRFTTTAKSLEIPAIGFNKIY